MHFVLKDKYPIETVEQVKTASVYFETHLRRFDFVDRSVAATAIEKRASELNVKLNSDWIKNYGRMLKKQASYSPTFDSAIKARKDMCAHYNVKIANEGTYIDSKILLEKIAAEKDAMDPSDMVSTLAEFDKLARLDLHYDSRIMDPIMSVFGNLIDSNYDRVKIAGDLFDTDFQSAAANPSVIIAINNSLGEDIGRDFGINPSATYENMSSANQALIEDIIRDNG
jgi:hypothetical protein